jgi:hypothetical protein
MILHARLETHHPQPPLTKTRPHPTQTRPAPVAVYRDRPLRWRDLLFLFLPACAAPLLPLAIGCWREQYGLSNYGPAAASAWSLPWYRLSLVALIPLLWLALRRVRQSHRVIRIFPQGITIQSTAGRRWRFSWPEIQGISSTKVCYSFLGISLNCKYEARLYPVEQKPIRLDNLPALEELCARIKAEIHPVLLQQYRRAFQNGETLVFGPVKINRDEIMVKKKSIPWRQLERLEPAGGFLHLVQKNNHPLKLPVQEVPNIELLLQIIQEGTKYGI